MKDIQGRYDELENLVENLNLAISEIKDDYYRTALYELKIEAENEIEDLTEELQKEQYQEEYEMNYQYERSVV